MSEIVDLDVYDLQYLMAENAYRVSIERKFRLERQIAQLQEDLSQHMHELEKFEKVVGILRSRTRVRY